METTTTNPLPKEGPVGNPLITTVSGDKTLAISN